MRLLLDTHVLLWWLADDGPQLGRARAEAIALAVKSGERLGVSVISLWEIAKLLELDRIRLPRAVDSLFDELETHPQVSLLGLSPRIAIESTRLGPRFHRDPADQLIAATARVHGLRLVTADEKIRSSGTVAVV